MTTTEPKVRVGHERGDLLHLLDQVLHGDLMLAEVFTKHAARCAINDAREAIRAAMALLDNNEGIDFAEIAAPRGRD